jgi:hypothetical protein
VRPVRAIIIWLILLCFNLAAPIARADDACTDFKWDVSKERALFAKTAKLVKAGTEAKTAPTLLPDQIYQLQLAPQASVHFAVEPGRQSRADSDHGGIATLKVPVGGAYRVALDVPLWIDVATGGALLTAKDFQGQHDCSAPHKIVEFELPAGAPLSLQLSSSAAESVRLTITSSPARKL